MQSLVEKNMKRTISYTPIIGIELIRQLLVRDTWASLQEDLAVKFFCPPDGRTI